MAIEPDKIEYCLLFTQNWWTCMTRGEWASWVQAIGTVAAILAGAGAVWWQVTQQGRRERMSRLSQDLDAIKSVGSLLAYAHVRLELAFVASRNLDDLRSYLATTYRLDEFHHIRTALLETHPREIPGAELRLAFLSGRASFVRAIDLLDQLEQDHVCNRWHAVDGDRLSWLQGHLSKEVAMLDAKQERFEQRSTELERRAK